MIAFGEWFKSSRSATGADAACLEVALGHLVSETGGGRRFIPTWSDNSRRPAYSADPVEWVAAHPGEWLASSRHVPAASLSMERFDPAREQPNGEERRPGLLAGRATLIRANVRKVQTSGGTRVREFTLALPVLPGDLPLADVTRFEARLQGLLDAHINRRYRLPRSQDQLHVWVALTPFRSHGEGIQLTATRATHDADQLHLDVVHDSDGVLLHELLHYLGLGDRSHDLWSLFRHSPGSPAVHANGLMARTDPDTVEAGLLDRDLELIEDVSDSGPHIPGSASGRSAFAERDDAVDGYRGLLPESALKIAASPDAIPAHPPSRVPTWWGIGRQPAQPGPYDGDYYTLPAQLSRHLHRLPAAPGGRYHSALAAGDLARVSDLIREDQREDRARTLDLILDRSTVSTVGLTDHRLRELLNDSLLREYPEIETYLVRHNQQSTDDRNTGIDRWRSEGFRLDSGKITVHYDPTGPSGRLVGLIKRAVYLVEAAGFVIPDLVVYLPKYARRLEISADASSGVEELLIASHEEDGLDAFARFFAPNEIIISAELAAIEDPDREANRNPYGLEDSFDEKAVAQIIHELGHHLHSHQSPYIVAHLWNTALLDPSVGAEIGSVSEYASVGDSIEEFVAEYFLSYVFEKPYSREVDVGFLEQLYRDLGGPLPRLGRRDIGPDIDGEKLRILTARVNAILSAAGDRRIMTEQIVADYHARLSPYTRRLVLRERAFWIVQRMQLEP
ncbi:hypothetical protein [Actinoallomurus sp. CA-142502]|uniref:hypothetical protein n=1 Tax=Actinoallomurus sp. CA-142502 TaxID=3239885 RepID=UPI003D92D7CD